MMDVMVKIDSVAKLIITPLIIITHDMTSAVRVLLNITEKRNARTICKCGYGYIKGEKMRNCLF